MKYLGIDFGLRRVGLAVAEGSLSSPWKVIEVKSINDAADKVLEILEKEGFDKVIVGMPEGKMSQNTTGFIRKLKEKSVVIETIDEHLSSYQATKMMIESNIPIKKRRLNDAQAAAIILQNYLDSL